MRYLLLGLSILAIGGGYWAFSMNAQAEEKAPEVAVQSSGTVSALKISVVDIEKILSTSKAAKSIKAQVEEKRKGFISEVEAAEKKLRDSQKAIEKESKNLKKEELVKKAQEFEKQRLAARKSIQERKAKLDKAYTEAMNALTKNIYEVCQKIADSKKIDLVITRQNIIVGSMALDITDEVLKSLDEALPSVDLKEK